MIRRQGQIAVLVLLLSMLGLAVGLSSASRSLSDLKQVTYVDSGTRAMAAAETGLQYAFANSSNWQPVSQADCDGPSGYQTVPLSLFGIKSSSNNGVQYKVCNVSRDAVTVPDVAKDDVAQIDLSGSHSNLKAFDVSWRGDASVEIVVLDSNGALRRYAFNSSTPVGQGRSSTNSFATGMPGATCASGGSICDSSFGGTNDSCTGYGEIVYSPVGGVTAQMVRIKSLYQATDISICGRAAGNSQVRFGLQYYRVLALATTEFGSVKRIQADWYPAALPTVFDNVFYSGVNISK